MNELLLTIYLTISFRFLSIPDNHLKIQELFSTDTFNKPFFGGGGTGGGEVGFIFMKNSVESMSFIS